MVLNVKLRKGIALLIAVTMLLSPILAYANETEQMKVFLDDDAKIEFLLTELERIDKVLEELKERRTFYLNRIELLSGNQPERTPDDGLDTPEYPEPQYPNDEYYENGYQNDDATSNKEADETYDTTITDDMTSDNEAPVVDDTSGFDNAPASDDTSFLISLIRTFITPVHASEFHYEADVDSFFDEFGSGNIITNTQLDIYLEILAGIDAQIEHYEALLHEVLLALAELMQGQYQPIMPLTGQLIPPSAFQTLNFEVRRGLGNPNAGTPPAFWSDTYSLNFNFVLHPGTPANVGDFFYIVMPISSPDGVAISIAPSGLGYITLPGHFNAHVSIVADEIHVRLIIYEIEYEHNISGHGTVGIEMRFEGQGYVYWEVDGYTYRGFANPTVYRPTGFLPRSWVPEKVGTNSMGSVETGFHSTWTVRLNEQGMPADEFFYRFGGAPSAPPVIRVEDLMGVTDQQGNPTFGGHDLVYFNFPGWGARPNSFASTNGYISITSVDLSAVWTFFQLAYAEDGDPTYLGPTTPIRNQITAEINTNWSHLNLTPIDFSVFATPIITPQGGFEANAVMNSFIFGLSMGNASTSAAPSLEVVRNVIVDDWDFIEIEGQRQGFFVDIPSHYFNNSMVTMRYRTLVRPGTPPQARLTNRLNFGGEMDEGYTLNRFAIHPHGTVLDAEASNIEIRKLDADAPNEPLSGAVFTIERHYGRLFQNAAGEWEREFFTAAQGADADGRIHITSGVNGIARTLQGLGFYDVDERFVIRELTPPQNFAAFPAGTQIVISIDPANSFAIKIITIDDVADPAIQPFTTPALLSQNGLLRLDGNTLVVYNEPAGEQPNPSISILKTASNLTPAPGQTITYELVVTNTGNVPLTNVIVTDVLPVYLTNPTAPVATPNTGVTGGFTGQNLNLVIANLPAAGMPGNAVTITFDVTIATAGTGEGQVHNGQLIPNTANVVGTPPSGSADNVTSSNNETVTVTIQDAPAVSISKTASLATPAVTADGTITVTYTLVVTNSGNVPLNGLVVTDPLDQRLINPDFVSLPQGATNYGFGATAPYALTVSLAPLSNVVPYNTVTIVFTAEIAPGTLTGEEIENIARVTYNLDVYDTDDATVLVPQNPAILVEKSVDEETVKAGGYLEYTIVVTNNGNVPFHSVLITDDLAKIFDDIDLDGTEMVDVTITHPVNADTTSEITLALLMGGQDFGPLAVNGTITLTFTVRVCDDALGGTELENTASATGNTAIPNTIENVVRTGEDTATSTVIGEPAITIAKSVDKYEYVVAGQDLTYTIVVTNTGNVPLINVIIRDPLTEMLPYLEFDGLETVTAVFSTESRATITAPLTTLKDPGLEIGQLVAGEYVTLTFTVTVCEDAPGGTLLENTANVTGRTHYCDEGYYETFNPDAKAYTKVKAEPGIEIEKSSYPFIVDASDGEELEYTIIVTNTGNVALYNVTIADSLVGILNYLDGTIAQIGAIIVDVVFSDARPDETITLAQLMVGYNFGTLVIDGTITLTFSVPIYENTPGGTKLENEATVTSEVFDPEVDGLVDGPSGEDTAISYVYPVALIEIDKSVDKEYVTAGEYLKYTLVIRNPGNFELLNVTVQDELTEILPYIYGDPADIDAIVVNVEFTNANGDTIAIPPIELVELMEGFNFGSLAMGETITLTFEVKVAYGAPGRTLLENTATVTSVTEDPDVNDPYDEDTATSEVIVEASIQIEKAVDRDVVLAGGNLEYTILVTNTGNVTLIDVVVTDSLEYVLPHLAGELAEIRARIVNITFSDGTTDTITLGELMDGFEIGELEAGDYVEFEFTVTVALGTPNGTPLDNKATVTGTTDEENINDRTPVSDEYDVYTYVVDDITLPQPTPNVEITKEANVFVIESGEQFYYTIIVENTGNGSARDVVVTDEIPAGVTFVSASANPTGIALAFDTTNRTLTADIGTLLAGDVIEITIVVTADPVDNATQVVNEAVVSGSNFDPSYDDATVYILPLNAAILTLDKEAYPTIRNPNQLVTYTFTVKNVGNNSAYNIEIVDELPSGLAFVRFVSVEGVNETNFDYSFVDGVLTVTYAGPLYAGESFTFSIEARVTQTTAGDITNTARVYENKIQHDEASATITVQIPPRRGTTTPRPPGDTNDIPEEPGPGQNIPGQDDPAIRDENGYTTIDGGDIPLADWDDRNNVPLGDIPQTGATGAGSSTMILSLMALIALAVIGRNRKKIDTL